MRIFINTAALKSVNGVWYRCLSIHWTFSHKQGLVLPLSTNIQVFCLMIHFMSLQEKTKECESSSCASFHSFLASLVKDNMMKAIYWTSLKTKNNVLPHWTCTTKRGLHFKKPHGMATNVVNRAWTFLTAVSHTGTKCAAGKQLAIQLVD